MPVTVVVGPGGVRSSALQSDLSNWAATALAAIDDEFALMDEHPVAVTALWRELFASFLGDEPLLLVCPSWWSERRVATVTDAARATAGKVAVRRRAEALAAEGGRPRAVVVEIAASFVAITRMPGAIFDATVRRQDDPASVADDVARQVVSVAGDSVVVDCADGVDGAAELAGMLAERLRAPGLRVTIVDDGRLSQASEPPEPGERRSARVEFGTAAAGPQIRRRTAAVAGAAATVVLAAVVVAASDPTARAPRTTLLVEGRIAVEVPASWSARRVTGGPGSVRLQVISPTDPQAALHVTQSSVSDTETLDDTADTLRRALADEPPGVFVDFNPDDRRGDREAVTYREIRTGHDIRWAVLLDKGLRISIGCQSARGTEDTVASICERAIASARQVGGTAAAQSRSNT
ncbi:MAG TPA: type VII secretion-associated protein [Mycobacterium sp.]